MQVADSTVTDAEELGFQEEGVSYTFRELLDMLAQTPDIILTMPSEQVPALRAGLSARKAKDTQKMSNAGVKADALALSFLVYPAKDEKTGQALEGQSCVRIRLAPRKGVVISSIQLPKETF